MKSFSFRLESLYKVRVAEQQTAENKLTEVNNQIQELRNLMTLLKEKQQSATNDYLLSLSSNNMFREISLQTQYINSLIEQEKDLNNQINNLLKVRDIKRQEVTQAANKVKIIDKLRENSFNAYLLENARIEQLFVDELAMLAFVRKDK